MEQTLEQARRALQAEIHPHGAGFQCARLGRDASMIDYLLFLLSVVATFATILAGIWGGIAIWLTTELIVEKIKKR